MNYSDENQQGLLSLLSAAQSGLDPSTAYTMLQDIQGNQEAQLAQRRERQSGLIGLLMESAQGGMPYAGAEAMMDAAPGPMGPALQSALESMYPGGGALPTNASGAVMDMPAGSRAIDPATGMANPYAAPDAVPTGPNALSPAFVPPQPTISEQQTLMDMEQQQAVQSDLTAMQADAAARRAEGWTVDDFIAKASSQNPELFATAPEEVMAIIENTFGAGAVEMRGIGV